MTASGRSPSGPGPGRQERRERDPRMPRRRRGALRSRRFRGAGALLGVLLLAALAGAALAAHYETRAAERVQALDRAAGRVFAGWMQAAHRATQAHADAFETALETQVGIVLTVARMSALGAAPPDLPERPGRHAAMTIGVMRDGTAAADADGVRRAGARCLVASHGDARGRAGGGPRGRGARPAVLSWRRTGRRSRRRWGGAWARDALWVTADLGIRYRERALHRRAQPGRPWLNRMETTLEMAPPGAADPADPARRNIAGAGAVDAELAEIGADVAAGGDADGGRPRGCGGAEGGDGRGGRSRGGHARGERRSRGGRRSVTDRLAADRVTATGSLEAGAVRSTGALDAAALSVAGAASVQGATAAQGGRRRESRRGAVAERNGTAAGGVYGPDATISGLLTVGSCAGCEGE